jgi:hypothetical protein
VRLGEAERLKAIDKLIEDQLGSGAPLVTLWASDVRLLQSARADAVEKKRVGPPAHLAGFYPWIAFHFLWLKPQRRLAKVAYADVCKAWGVTKTVVVEALKDHDDAARKLLDTAACATTLPPARARKNTHAIWKNIELMVRAYKRAKRPTDLSRLKRNTQLHD